MSEDYTLIIVFWLTSVFVIFQKQKMLQTTSALLLENSIVSYRNPSPELVKVFVLTGLLYLPLIPIMMKSPIIQSMQTCIAIASLVIWMILSFTVLQRPCMFRPIPITHFGSIRSLISV